MTFQPKRSYDDEEYAAAHPTLPADPGRAGDADGEDLAAPAGGSAAAFGAWETEDDGALDADGEPAPQPRPTPRPAPPAPSRKGERSVVSAGRPAKGGAATAGVRPARGTRDAAAVRPGSRTPRGPGGQAGRGVRVAPTTRIAQRDGLPMWVIPVALGVVVLLGIAGASLFLNPNQPPAPVALPAGVAATAAAQNTALATVVGNVSVNTNGPPGIAATINGKPIPVAAWQERLQVAKEDYSSQFQMNFDNTDVGKRMADVLGFDVLDQMINFEVLMQQAQKEQIIPNPTQVEQRYNDIRTSTAQQKQTWDQFLSSQHMSDPEFRQNIVDAFTYLVIAGNHTTQSKSDTDKAAELATYICSTRTKYDVKVYVQFLVPQTPCSSALEVPGGPPANLTVTARPQQPNPVETGGPPLAAPATPKK